MISLKGNPLKQEIQERLSQEITKLCGTSEGSGGIKPRPHLAIILVGDNARSTVYIEQKKKFALAIGAELSLFQYSETITPTELCAEIKKLAERIDVHGMILQLPLPTSFTKEDIEKSLDTIPPHKDADGITSTNSGLLMKESKYAIVPATARGIVEMLKHYQVNVSGKHVVVVGRSHLVGKPIALTLLARDATVTVCHKSTTNIPEIARTADILISATGVSGLITKEYVKEGQIIIDVGISVNEEGKISGDVDLSVEEINIAARSPVPGGVGPMTVSGLFLNLMDLYRKQISL